MRRCLPEEFLCARPNKSPPGSKTWENFGQPHVCHGSYFFGFTSSHAVFRVIRRRENEERERGREIERKISEEEAEEERRRRMREKVDADRTSQKRTTRWMNKSHMTRVWKKSIKMEIERQIEAGTNNSEKSKEVKTGRKCENPRETIACNNVLTRLSLVKSHKQVLKKTCSKVWK